MSLVFICPPQPPLRAPAVPQVLYKGDPHHQVRLEQAGEGVRHLLRRPDSGRGVVMQRPGRRRAGPPGDRSDSPTGRDRLTSSSRPPTVTKVPAERST